MSDEFNWKNLVDRQQNVLLRGLAPSVCIYQFTRVLEAASKADDINNGRDEDWPPHYFRATYTREKRGGKYEVLVKLRPEVPRRYTKPPAGVLPEILLFREELGGGSIASRAANALYRWRVIDSMEKLQEVYRQLGEAEFRREFGELSNIGRTVVDLVVRRVKGER
jgi:hypothetical protein